MGTRVFYFKINKEAADLSFKCGRREILAKVGLVLVMTHQGHCLDDRPPYVNDSDACIN